MKVLITGGAGFIGSSLALRCLQRGDDVVVLDDLSTGFRENAPEGAEFIEGTIEDLDTVKRVVHRAEIVFHEAASRAVLRSVDDPIGTNRANVEGTMNVLVAARDAGVRRVVLASSSSVYGGVAPVPTREDAPLTPKSPYAVSKLAGEHYARVFSELYGIETVSLRYFNVFGPRQRPDSAYAAVIPLLIDALKTRTPPIIHGDGKQTRDFTYIDDVVDANLRAAEAPAGRVNGCALNIGRGDQTSLLDILEHLGEILGVHPEPTFTDPRPGDVRLSQADISAAQAGLGFQPQTGIREGLVATVEWFSRNPS